MNPIDYDYVLWVDAGYKPSLGSTMAYASDCMRDLNHNGRPVMGSVFINTNIMHMNIDKF